MNLLITGALGHIGSRLIREITVGKFQNVSLLDNLSTQRYPALFNLPEDVPFRFFEDDILTADLEAYFDGVDIVIHLAASTEVEASTANPGMVHLTNVEGTRRVAKACVVCGSKLIFISTTSVYGIQGNEVDEDCPLNGLRPQNPYAESKLQAEFFLQQLAEREELNFVICRFGTIFGFSIGMRFHTAVNKFVWQACTGQPLTVWSAALNQVRPYLDLSDAVEALKFIVQRDLFDCRVYNFATTNTTVRRVIEIIASYVPHLSIKYVEAEIMNQLSYGVSNSRIRSQGFEFKGNLEKGIAELIQQLKGMRRF